MAIKKKTDPVAPLHPDFAKVVKAFAKDPHITPPGNGKGFGSSALKINGKIFAMISSRDKFVVRLPRERVGDMHLMACDDCTRKHTAFQGFSLSLSVANKSEAKRVFMALAAGGHVGMPLAKTFFSPCFGMLKDKFGVGWMVIVPA